MARERERELGTGLGRYIGNVAEVFIDLLGQ